MQCIWALGGPTTIYEAQFEFEFEFKFKLLAEPNSVATFIQLSPIKLGTILFYFSPSTN